MNMRPGREDYLFAKDATIHDVVEAQLLCHRRHVHPSGRPSLSLNFHCGVETQLPWVHFDDDLPRTRCDEDPGLAAAFVAAEASEDFPFMGQY